MWKKRLDEVIKEKELYGEKVNVGATAETVKKFCGKVKRELFVELPKEYVDILQTVNGLEFNGFILYGTDESLLEEVPNQHINGLIEYNKVWYENEGQKRYVFLGESHISWYVYDLIDKKYYELDSPSGRESGSFDSVECLVEKILCDALE